ncbi:hypothetical protein [Alcanivorax jadensis]|uniref:hypothetical protein n=1 Tax=Alcanivorax jadensis TaxID=64988 RepID=UPI0023563B1B|nr:hypothetical protein [Alcanivorax jadensis]|tara:strand:+ start:2696 stop:2887 length:192 start_codon:yes stop_codon:yes gene_type:complete
MGKKKDYTILVFAIALPLLMVLAGLLLLALGWTDKEGFQGMLVVVVMQSVVLFLVWWNGDRNA